MFTPDIVLSFKTCHCFLSLFYNYIINVMIFFCIRPAVVIEVDTLSDENPESVRDAVEKALSAAASDGIVGNLEVDSDSVAVMEPHVEKTPSGN